MTAQFKKPIHVVLPAVYGLLNFKNILIPRGDSQVQLRELSPYPIQHAFGGRIGCAARKNVSRVVAIIGGLATARGPH